MSKIDPASVTWDEPQGIVWDDEKPTRQPAQSRFAAGLTDPVHGGAQMLENAVRAVSPQAVEAVNRFNNWLADKGLVAKLPAGGVDQAVREREASLKTGGMDWSRLAGNVLSPMNTIGGLASAATLPGRMAAGTGLGAMSAAMMPNSGDAGGKLTQMSVGAAGGAATPALFAGLGRLISPKASVNPDVQRLRDVGIRPTIGETLGGTANKIEEKATSLPIVGDAIRNARMRGWEDLNTAVAARALAPIGQAPAPNAMGRKLVDDVHTKLSAAYDDLLPKLTIKADEEFMSSVDSIRRMVKTGSISPEAASSFQRILKSDVVGKLRGQNALTGQTFKDIESDLGKKIRAMSRSDDPDMVLASTALQEVREQLRDLLARSNPEAAKQLRSINEGWAVYERMYRASSALGAGDGVFSPAQLQNAVKTMAGRKKDFGRGNALLQELSDPAKSVMGSSVPDSGTAGRLLSLPNVMTGGLAGLYDPTLLAAPVIGAGLYSRPAQGLLTSLVASRPNAAQPIAGLLNRSSPMLSPAGGLLALDALE